MLNCKYTWVTAKHSFQIYVLVLYQCRPFHGASWNLLEIMFCALFFHWSYCWSSSLGNLGQESLFALPGMSTQRVNQACRLLPRALSLWTVSAPAPFVFRVLEKICGSKLLPAASDLSRFFPWFDRIFTERHFTQFLANKMQEFLNICLHNCILIFYAEKFTGHFQSPTLWIRKLQQTLHPKP